MYGTGSRRVEGDLVITYLRFVYAYFGYHYESFPLFCALDVPRNIYFPIAITNV